MLEMNLGVVFPQTEIGDDPVKVRDYAQAAEALGYDHMLCFEHVLGANPESRPGWSGPYSSVDIFHEPFVLFSHLAAITKRIEFMTGILVLPQRQTALVAKQAAALDVLSGGRFRLGIGVGWNEVEYEALDENFRNRGRRSEEQVEVMRQLWTHETITFQGEWHTITDAGIKPLPVQRPIPIWFGGAADRVLRRIARLADGWLMELDAGDPGMGGQIETMHGYLREAGRDPAAFPIEAWIRHANRAPEEWAEAAAELVRLGCSHVCLDSMRAGIGGADAHIEAIRQFHEAVSARLGGS
jgi:probable F420-dependent oxidoreductase